MIYQAPQAPNRGRWYKVSPAPENGLLTVHKTHDMTNTIYIHQPEKAFSFTRLPNFLFEAPTFKALSNEAKVVRLYPAPDRVIPQEWVGG